MSQIRIVSGLWRSRRIEVIESEGLRPTPDRVRETLFNWLGQDLQGWSCLDLFAGSGVLGFEAASRGASSVTLVEQDRKVHAVLLRNRELLAGASGHGGLEIVRGDALEYAVRAQQRYDLVLLDPPFGCGWLERLEPMLDNILKEDGCLYVEAEQTIVSLGAWQTYKHGKAGAVHYQLLQRATA